MKTTEEWAKAHPGAGVPQDLRLEFVGGIQRNALKAAAEKCKKESAHWVGSGYAGDGIRAAENCANIILAMMPDDVKDEQMAAGPTTEEIREAIGFMRDRLTTGQGNYTTAMCRLSLPMSEALLTERDDLKAKLDNAEFDLEAMAVSEKDGWESANNRAAERDQLHAELERNEEEWDAKWDKHCKRHEEKEATLRGELEQERINTAPNPRCTKGLHAMTAADQTDPMGRCLWCTDLINLEQCRRERDGAYAKLTIRQPTTVSEIELQLNEARTTIETDRRNREAVEKIHIGFLETIAEQAETIKRLEALVPHDDGCTWRPDILDDDLHRPCNCARPAKLAAAKKTTSEKQTK